MRSSFRCCVLFPRLFLVVARQSPSFDTGYIGAGQLLKGATGQRARSQMGGETHTVATKVFSSFKKKKNKIIIIKKNRFAALSCSSTISSLWCVCVCVPLRYIALHLCVSHFILVVTSPSISCPFERTKKQKQASNQEQREFRWLNENQIEHELYTPCVSSGNETSAS